MSRSKLSRVTGCSPMFSNPGRVMLEDVMAARCGLTSCRLMAEVMRF